MAAPRRSGTRRTPTEAQAAWLRHGLQQPGGKLPLFDSRGQRVKKTLIGACLKAGWAEPWFENPLKRDWQVCRLTESGRALALARNNVVTVDFSQGALALGTDGA
jgi:hypothetical protein